MRGREWASLQIFSPMTERYQIDEEMIGVTTDVDSVSTDALNARAQAFNKQLEREVVGAARAGYDWVAIISIVDGYEFERHVHLHDGEPVTNYSRLIDGDVTAVEHYDLFEVREQLERKYSAANPSSLF